MANENSDVANGVTLRQGKQTHDVFELVIIRAADTNTYVAGTLYMTDDSHAGYVIPLTATNEVRGQIIKLIDPTDPGKEVSIRTSDGNECWAVGRKVQADDIYEAQDDSDASPISLTNGRYLGTDLFDLVIGTIDTDDLIPTDEIDASSAGASKMITLLSGAAPSGCALAQGPKNIAGDYQRLRFKFSKIES